MDTLFHPKRNVDRAEALIRDAAKQGAHIAVTQELFTQPYFCQVEDDRRFALAESIPGPTSDRLCTLAKELGIEIVASLFERRTAGVYHNTSILIDHHGQIAGKYRKMHIPDDPRFFEKYYFTPGDAQGLAWQTQQTRHATTGILICWDQWFPEAARLTALRGAQILFYPTAIGYYHGEAAGVPQQQRDAWMTIQRSHAIANGVFVAAVNRVGVEDDLTFWGTSFVVDPFGSVVAQASQDQETVLLADCDLGKIEQARQGWPFLRDRRVDAYAELTRRYID